MRLQMDKVFKDSSPSIAVFGKNSGTDIHCVKSVLAYSFSGPHFSAFGLNGEIYRVTPNKDTFSKVGIIDIACPFDN